MVRLLPKALAATLLVAVAPLTAAWTLRATGLVSSPLMAALGGGILALGLCQLAARVWERRAGTGDVLFGDLLLWGWARRWLQEHRLRSAVATLGLHRTLGGTDPLTLSVERRVGLLERLAGRLEAGDPYTHGHSRRVARYASMIAKRMGVPGAELARIRTAAAVHDVGKLQIPAAVLHKPGPLTEEEFELVKQHAADGAVMVSILEDELLTAIVRHHHERLDGTGYPDRLSGAGIPLGSRIIAVADTFDAITSARPYRVAKPHRAALQILRAEAGRQLDGDAVNAFCSVYSGRRGLGAWVALTDGGERLLAWLLGDAISTPTRLAAIVAGTAAVSTGAVALPAVAQRVASAKPPTAVVERPRSAHAATGPHGARAHVANAARVAEHVSLGQAARRPAPSAPGHGTAPVATGPTQAGGAGAPNGPATIATAAAPSSGAGPAAASPPAPGAPGAGSGSGSGSETTSGSGGPITVSVGGGSPPVAAVQLGGSGSQVASVQAGGSGPVTASATVGGAQNGPPGVSVGSGSGGKGAAVTVNAPGLASVKIGLG